MLRFLVVALVSAFPTSFTTLHAQEGPGPPPSMVQQKRAKTKPLPSLPIGRITGTVFCADTHRPARGALVMLAPKPDNNGGQNENMSRVGMDGSYAFEHISPGEYAVVAVLPGYLNPFDGVTIAPNSDDSLSEKMWRHESERGILKINAGEALKFDIELQRGAAISGRVLYSDGAPAAQVVIEVQDTAKDKEKNDPAGPSIELGGFVREAARQSLSTDDVGHFRLSGLNPGTYRIMAIELSKANDGFEGAGAIEDPLAVRVYAGDTLHRKAAKIYELRAGEETAGIDITIPLEAFHSVRGHVSALDGRSLNMGDLTLTDPDDDTFSMSTKLQKDGSFNFPSVPKGTYTLSTKNARIGEVPVDAAVMFESNNVPLEPKTAFGDNTQSIVVADVDLADVNVSLTEVPMPKPTAHPNR